jgi:hypothetical protein
MMILLSFRGESRDITSRSLSAGIASHRCLPHLFAESCHAAGVAGLAAAGTRFRFLPSCLNVLSSISVMI